MEQLSGKVAVVTGAASGIGLALARRFASEGMHVVLADIDAGALDAAAAELGATGVETATVPTDVSDPAAVDELASRAFQRFGTVHVVCNNAGVGGASGAPDWEKPLTEWEWVLGVNLFGVIHGVRAFLPRLVEQGVGHVVNTASMAGLAPIPFMGPYSASKQAVVAISEAVFHELRAVGSPVGISVLCPAFVATRIADSGRARPDRLGGPLPVGETGADPMLDLVRAMVDGGIPADDVAEAVVDAVRAKRFWILTHHEFDELLRDRTAGIVEGRDPPSPLG